MVRCASRDLPVDGLRDGLAEGEEGVGGVRPRRAAPGVVVVSTPCAREQSAEPSEHRVGGRVVGPGDVGGGVAASTSDAERRSWKSTAVAALGGDREPEALDRAVVTQEGERASVEVLDRGDVDAVSGVRRPIGGATEVVGEGQRARLARGTGRGRRTHDGSRRSTPSVTLVTTPSVPSAPMNRSTRSMSGAA